MSFVVWNKDAIVLAADRRTVHYQETKDHLGRVLQREGFRCEEEPHLFLCPNGAAVAVTGEPKFENESTPRLAARLARTLITPETSVFEMVSVLGQYFTESGKAPAIVLQIAGFGEENGVPVPYACKLDIRGRRLERQDTEMPGATINGEQEMFLRLYRPADVYLGSTKHHFAEPGLPLSLYSTQDMIDFARFSVEVTGKAQRFSIGNRTVGEEADVLLLQPGESRWMNRQEIH